MEWDQEREKCHDGFLIGTYGIEKSRASRRLVVGWSGFDLI